MSQHDPTSTQEPPENPDGITAEDIRKLKIRFGKEPGDRRSRGKSTPSLGTGTTHGILSGKPDPTFGR